MRIVSHTQSFQSQKVHILGLQCSDDVQVDFLGRGWVPACAVQNDKVFGISSMLVKSLDNPIDISTTRHSGGNDGIYFGHFCELKLMQQF